MENKVKKSSTPFLLYANANNQVKVDVLLKDETIWLNQKQIAELFSVQVPAIAKHISNILGDMELSLSTISKMETVQKEGSREVKRNIDFYNLDMIIAVGYRVNSKQATHFRIWATKVLKEYIIKGFALNMVYELYGLSEDEIAIVEGRDADSAENEIGYNTPMKEYR